VQLAALLLLSGCTSLRTTKEQYAGIDSLLAKVDYPAALARIQAGKRTAYTHKDRVVYYLDVGMLHHWNGDYGKSNEFLELAERAMEENFTKSIARSASSLILNDNILAYAGEDYEDVYLNAFKALNYLALDQNDSAFVEVRRINNKLVQLESRNEKTARRLNEAEAADEKFEAGKSRFQDSALGRYLSMLLYRNDALWDDVRIDLEQMTRGWKLQPEIYPFAMPDLSRSTQRVYPPTARLNVIAFSGAAPDKQASTFYIHTEENLIVLGGTSENYLGGQTLTGLNFISWPGVQEGYHFKIQLPYIRKRPSRVERIEVAVSGTEPQTLQRLESLENAAVETFNIKKPMIYLKTIIRTVSKGIAAENKKADMTKNMDKTAAFFTRLFTDLAMDQTEYADLRMSRFFPAEAAISEIHLNEGVYDIRINYYSASGTLLHSDIRKEVKIRADQLNVLESAYLN
jgi:hypothetical protein